MKQDTAYKNLVVIIGAGRSGTNILRDSLTSLSGVDTWPCDEINYIWRYGNRGSNTDELKIEDVSAVRKARIRKYFNDEAKALGCETLVEKTCANSLRVGYVNGLFPEAKFVFIVRDGRDVVASALKRWKAKLEIKYLAHKAKFVPKSDILYYAFRYGINRVKKVFSRENRLSSWGPRFEGMDEVLKNKPLEHAAATQWLRSVDLSQKAFKNIDSSRVLEIRYENLTNKSEETLTEVFDFLGLKYTEEELNKIASKIHSSSVGKWKKNLTAEQQKVVLPIVEEKLKELNYEK